MTKVGNPIPYPPVVSVWIVLFLELLAVIISAIGILAFTDGKISVRRAFTVAVVVETASFIPTLFLLIAGGILVF